MSAAEPGVRSVSRGTKDGYMAVPGPGPIGLPSTAATRSKDTKHQSGLMRPPACRRTALHVRRVKSGLEPLAGHAVPVHLRRRALASVPIRPWTIGAACMVQPCLTRNFT